MPKDFDVEMGTKTKVSDIREFFENGAKKETEVDEVSGDFRQRTDSIPPPDPGAKGTGPWWFSWAPRRYKENTNGTNNSNNAGPERRASDTTTDIGNRQLTTRLADPIRSMFGYGMTIVMIPFNIGFYFISLAASLVHAGIRFAFLPLEYVWRVARRITGRGEPERVEQVRPVDDSDDDLDAELESDESTPPSTPVPPAELAEALVASTAAHSAQITSSPMNTGCSISSMNPVSPSHADSTRPTSVHVAIPTPEQLARVTPPNSTPTPPPSPTSGVDAEKELFRAKKDVEEGEREITIGLDHAPPPPPPPPLSSSSQPVAQPTSEFGSLNEAIHSVHLKDTWTGVEGEEPYLSGIPQQQMESPSSDRSPSNDVQQRVSPPIEVSPIQSSMGANGVHHVPPPPPPPPAPVSPLVPPTSGAGSLKEAINSVHLKEVPKPEAIQDTTPLEDKAPPIASALMRAVAERQAALNEQLGDNQDPPLRSDREWEE